MLSLQLLQLAVALAMLQHCLALLNSCDAW
jgi:hypothetical protein